MQRIAIIDTENQTILTVLPLMEGETEIATRYPLPYGLDVSPVYAGWESPEVSHDEVLTEGEAPVKIIDHPAGLFKTILVTSFELPEGKQVISGPTYALENDEVIESYEIEDIPVYIPDRVTSRQFKLALCGMPSMAFPSDPEKSLLDDVEGCVAGQSRFIKIAFADSGTFVRTDPMLQGGFQALGLTAEQIDQFFIAASQI